MMDPILLASDHRTRKTAIGQSGAAELPGDPELLPDLPTEAVFDFRMPRDRGFLTIGRIEVEVVATAMAMEDASGLPEFLEEGPSLHTSTSIDLLSASAGAAIADASDITKS
jgi:hypothetical protein